MKTPHPPKLTDQDILQGITDALGSIAVAVARQIDADQFVTDLNAIALELDQSQGHGPSAGLLDEIARHVQRTVLKVEGH